MPGNRIAIVANSSWNILNFRKDLIYHLISKGFQIIIIAPEDNYTEYISSWSGVKFIKLKQLKARAKNLFSDFKLFLEFYKIYRREKPDLIFQYTIKPNIYGSIAASCLNIPCVSTLTGLGYAFIGRFRFQKLLHIFYRLALSKNKKVIFHNEDDLKLWIEKSLVRQKMAMVIPGSGVDSNFFSPIPKPIREGPLIFLFLSRIQINKGIHEFIAAAEAVFRQTDHCIFWIAGHSDEVDSQEILKILSEMNSAFIQYKGACEDVREIMSKCDVLVLPSYREGLPRVILEAMAMEKPVITTDVAGCRELVTNYQNGFLVPARNATLLAKAIIDMVKLKPEQRFEMGMQGRKRILEKYEIKKILEYYDQLLMELG